jgi:hypothetical protein
MTKELSPSFKQGACLDSTILVPSAASAPRDRLLFCPLDPTAHAFCGAVAKVGFPHER